MKPLMTMKMLIPALLTVLVPLSSNQIFISSLSIECFGKDEETIPVLFSED